MEPRVLRVERVFPNSFLQGRNYSWFEYVFDGLVEEIKLRLCGCFANSQATFVMNRELYRLFYSVAPMIKGPYWNGIYIKEDLTPEHIPWDANEKPKGRILLEYREPIYIPFELTERRNGMPPESVINGFKIKEMYFDIHATMPKIKKVIFNDPATIVMWNDGTKTVVKCGTGDDFDPEKGVAMCVVKKTIGLKEFYKALNPAYDRWLNDLNLPEDSIWDRIKKMTQQ